MKKIEINSIESVILFTLYICAQDDVIAKEEIEELAAEAPILQKLYLDMYGELINQDLKEVIKDTCLLYTSPSPRDATLSRMPSSA